MSSGRIGLLSALWLVGCTGTPLPLTHSTPPTGPLPTPAELASLVRALAHDAASIRGLAFVREVPSRVVSSREVQEHFGEQLAAEREDQLLENRFGVAMGLLPPNTSDDAHDTRADVLGDEAQGYYEPGDATLYVAESEARALRRPGPAGLDARATIVHELVHALQHQHFEQRVEPSAGSPPTLSDQAHARVALLEGDATLVTLEWTARQRGGHLLDTPHLETDIARWTERAQILTEADVPRYVADAMELPYAAGTAAVGALYARGGWARVNAALADDTLSSASLLHPERVTRPVSITPSSPPAGLAPVASLTLGELQLRLLLTQIVRAERAAVLASSWRGDALGLFASTTGALALRWTIACPESSDATTLVSALQPMLSRWMREPCPRLRGGSSQACPVSAIIADGSSVTIVRGM